MSTSRWFAVAIAIGGVTLAGAGCTGVSKKKLAALKTQVDVERQQLTTLAEPVRVRELDYAVEVDKTPLLKIVDAFNGADRSFSIQSYAQSGYIKHHRWFRCPWPLSGHALWYIKLVRHDSLWARLKLGPLNGTWHPNDGLKFSIESEALLGGFAKGVVDTCIVQAPVAGIALAAHANPTLRGKTVASVTEDGAEFEFLVTSPSKIQLLVGAYVWGVGGIVVPLRADGLEKLGIIKMDNFAEEEGELRIDPKKNVCREYDLKSKATKAGILPSGLWTGGKLEVEWNEPGPCRD